MIVQSAPAPARYGYNAIVGRAVIPVRDLDEAAARMVAARATGERFDVRARITTGRERTLTASELGRLVALATALIAV